MNFKEQFPSLKGKNTDDIKTDCMTETIFHEEVIEKYCLDKQRVREILNSLNFKKAEIQTSEQAYRYRERRRFIAELILKLRLDNK